MNQYHLTANKAGNLFGHDTKHCDPSGCNAARVVHLGDMRGDHPPAVFLLVGDVLTPAFEEDLEQGQTIEIEVKTEFEHAVAAAVTLDELVIALNKPWGEPPTASEEMLMARLPTFGGEDLADTANVWSWDAARVIVQRSDGFRIVPREEVSR